MLLLVTTFSITGTGSCLPAVGHVYGICKGIYILWVQALCIKILEGGICRRTNKVIIYEDRHKTTHVRTERNMKF